MESARSDAALTIPEAVEGNGPSRARAQEAPCLLEKSNTSPGPEQDRVLLYWSTVAKVPSSTASMGEGVLPI